MHRKTPIALALALALAAPLAAAQAPAAVDTARQDSDPGRSAAAAAGAAAATSDTATSDAATSDAATSDAATIDAPAGDAPAGDATSSNVQVTADRDAATLDTVVVTATRANKAIDKIPGAVSVITRKEIDDQLRVSEDLSQLLSIQVPGYAPSRQKLTSFGESLRGRTPLILFDGIPQTNPLRAGAREGYFADPAVIERVEVVSGASAVQGLGATGGIINFISRTPREEGTHHTFDVKYGTQFHGDDATRKLGYMLEHKQRFDALLYLGSTWRGVGVDGDGNRLGLEGTQGDTMDSQATDVFAKVGLDFGQAQRVQLSYNRFQLEGDGDWVRVNGSRADGVPTSATRGTPPGIPPRNDVRTISAEWTHADLAGGSASVQVYKQDFEATYGAGVFTNFQDPTIAPDGELIDQSEIVADKTGVRTSWVRPELFTDALELTLGLDWLSDKSQQRLALTGRTWVPELEFESTAPFAQLEYEHGPFTVRGGVRREEADLHVDDYTSLAVYGRQQVEGGDRSFTQWVKSLGAVWRFADGWSTFVSYNEGFGLPDVGLVLRAVNQPGQSVARLIALEPVVTDNREVGLTWAGEHGSFTASVYDSRSELGSQVRVNNTTGIGSILRVPVEVEGFEFAGEWRPLEDWTFNATYAVTRGKTAVGEGAPVDVELGARSQGPDKLVGAVRWDMTPDLTLRMQAAHYYSRHINEGRKAGTSELEENFEGYTVADASLAWNSRWGEWGLGIENLFDEQYIGYYAQSNPAPSKLGEDYFAGHGRTYTISWKRRF